MKMFVLFALCMLAPPFFGSRAIAEEPPKKLSAAERDALEDKLTELNAAGIKTS